MNGKTIEESRAEYENSALKHLMEATDHEICPRCYCCDLVSDSAPCYLCGGFCDDWDDDWDDGYCSECGGEGEIYFKRCLGNCNEQGHHIQGTSSDLVGREVRNGPA